MDGLKAWLVGVHNAAWELELKLIESREEDGKLVLLYQVPFWEKRIRVVVPAPANKKRSNA